MTLGTNPPIKAGLSNSVEGKGSQCREKWQRVKVHKSTKIYNHSIYAKDLAQIHTGSVVDTLFSVRPYVLIVSLTSLVSRIVPLPLLWGSPGSIQNLTVSLCICCSQLLDDASVLSLGPGTDLWVQQNIIRNPFIHCQSCLGLSWVCGMPASGSLRP